MQRIFQVNYPRFISVLQFIIRPCQQIFFFTRKIIILFTAYNFRYFYNETKKGWKKEKREYGRLESNKNTGNYNSNKTRSCGIYACMFLPLTTAHASHDREIKRIKNVFLEKEEGKKKKKKKKRKNSLKDFCTMRNIRSINILFMNLFISIVKNLWNISKYTFYVSSSCIILKLVY